jgi:hypothetical protein
MLMMNKHPSKRDDKREYLGKNELAFIPYTLFFYNKPISVKLAQ